MPRSRRPIFAVADVEGRVARRHRQATLACCPDRQTRADCRHLASVLEPRRAAHRAAVRALATAARHVRALCLRGCAAELDRRTPRPQLLSQVRRVSDRRYQAARTEVRRAPIETLPQISVRANLVATTSAWRSSTSAQAWSFRQRPD